MKRFTLLFFIISCTFNLSLAQQNEELLLTIGDQPVYKEEFIRLITKNQAAAEIKKTNIQDALDIFINFKLKVTEARALGMDTARQFLGEMSDYRKQLGKPYLLDQEVTEELVREAYERGLWEIRASHILVGVAMDAPPADTLLAYQKAMQLREQLLRGADFQTLARDFSNDPSAVDNGGDLGYFTVMQMVYPFENAVYQTELGGISEPVRTQFGYHILTVTEKRPNQGKVQVAQIYKAFNYTMSDEEKEQVRQQALEIWEQLKAGADFAELANKQSDDRTTGPRGGLIPQWFGFGGMHPEFVDASFKLKNIGDFSEPVMTNMGYHVIKLVNKRDPESFEAQYPALLKSVKNSDRSQKSEQVVVEKLKKEYGFTLNQKAYEEFYRLVDPSVFSGKWDPNPAMQKREVLFTLNGKSFIQADFARFLALNMRQTRETTVAEFVDQKFNAFVHSQVLDYEESMLEKKYPDFKYLMKEFHEGNLIFEVSNLMIWSKAGQDSAGLLQFYHQHVNKYQWSERLNATILRVKGVDASDKTFKEIRKGFEDICKAEQDLEKIRQSTAQLLSGYPGTGFEVSGGKYSRGDNWAVDQIKWKKGMADPLNDGSATLLVWVREVLAQEPKPLNEIRGQVTADYQDHLEKEWIKSLRQKYPVKINEDVLSKITF